MVHMVHLSNSVFIKECSEWGLYRTGVRSVRGVPWEVASLSGLQFGYNEPLCLAGVADQIKTKLCSKGAA
jgi:hypothetical protein